MDKKTDLEIIKKMSEAFGPSGFEEEVIAEAGKYASFADTETDNIKNFYISLKGNAGKRPLVMLDAHSDEVGFMIHSVKENGCLNFVGLGGWSENTLPSTSVKIKTENGRFVSGQITSKPPHFSAAGEKNNITIADMAIDTGAKNRAECTKTLGNAVGLPAVCDTQFKHDEETDVMFGKAFDCRLGCAALIEAMNRLSDKQLSVDVTGVLSAQEEVGGRGACVAAKRLKPDVAICLEGTPADDTISQSYETQTFLGKGPMLRFIDRSMITHPKFLSFALAAADKNGVKYQTAVRTGGGTNGGVIHQLNEGIPTIVIGVPVRYIHSPSGIAAYFDFEETVKLTVAVIEALNEEAIKSFGEYK